MGGLERSLNHWLSDRGNRLIAVKNSKARMEESNYFHNL